MPLLLHSDTIAAISTPLGEGGIGVIRLTGPDALKNVGKVFFSSSGKPIDLSSVPSHTVHFGHILSPEGELIDEVLTTVMLAPRTYTREDTVEISCHGGLISVRRVLERVLAAGCRLAEPGEFTKRAFLNGRIDLAQAEAVIEIIRSKTETGQGIALRNLTGKLSQDVDGLRDSLVNTLVYLEASIDFPEDEIPPLDRDLSDIITDVSLRLKKLIGTARTGRIYREGLATTIVGKPNVGKSSLLNALVEEERAIVTNVPGTTRDLLEEYLNLDGLPLRLIDTAGIRTTTDEVEKIGVNRSMRAIQQADIILFMVDRSMPLEEEDFLIAASLPPEKTILVGNKNDLPEQADFTPLAKDFGEPIPISAEGRAGLEDLKAAVIQKASLLDVTSTESALVTNIRHLDALRRALESAQRGLESYQAGMPADFVTIDLREAVSALGEITGDTASEDLVNQIFSNFCIGK